MNNNGTHTSTYRAERTPSPAFGFLFCLAVLAGGAFAGHAWAADTCATPAAASRRLSATPSADTLTTG